MAGERALRVNGGRKCVPCTRERDKERIALSVDLDAAVRIDGATKDLAMIRECLGILRPERM
jgi:hypothetical protein